MIERAILFIVVVASLSNKVWAQTWNAGSGAWNVPANWTPAVIPNGAIDVTFPENSPGATSTVTIPGAYSIRNMTFTSTTQAYILSGGTLSATPLALGGISVSVGSPAHVLDTNFSFITTNPFTIDQDSTNDLTISGSIAGSVGISKTGTGTLVFSGATPSVNSGLFTINAGQVTLDKTAGVQAVGGNITVNAGILFWNQSEQMADTSTLSISNASTVIDLNGNTETVGALTVAATGAYALNGTLNLAGAGTVLSVATFSPTLTGQINLISGAGGNVSKTGAGTLGLQNVAVQNGAHGFAVTTGTIDISGKISGNGGIVKSGTGTLTFTGTEVNDYDGDTVVTAGTLNLNHTAGVAITNDCFISGGVLLLGSGNQIADTANVTVTSGSFNMNSMPETINSLILDGGTLINNGAGLTLNSTGTALSLRNSSIPGQINLTGATGGNVIFTDTGGNTGTLANVDLGSANRIFTVEDVPAAADLNITGVVSGAGGLTKMGFGLLQYSSNNSNSYTGLTTVSEGTLLLIKTAPFVAVQGDMLINGGTLRLGRTNQIADTSNVKIESGTFDLNNFNETVGSLNYLGGSLIQGSAVLSLSGTGTALTMRDTVVNGTVSLTGASGGGVVFDSSNGGMAFINNILLGNVSRTFTVGGGNDSNVKMAILNSSGTGGALIKDGPGILELIGLNTYTIDSARVVNGTLAVQGSLNAPALIVEPEGVVKGCGTIMAAGTINGTLKPGNSIGTINLVGDQVFGSTFVLENEINQTETDLVNITGMLTIDPGAAVSVIPLISNFTVPTTYTIIQTTAGVSGTFSSVNNPSLFYSSSLIYNPLTVQLTLDSIGFSQIVTAGNAGVVANYLDSLNIQPGSDLAAVFNALRQLTTQEALENALFQLQPSPLKGLALSQENNAFQIESYILERTRPKCCVDNQRANLWVLFAGDQYNQNSIQEEKPFQTASGHALIGIDRYVNDSALIGIAGGYTYSDVNWEKIKDKATINNGTLALYGHVKTDYIFVDGAILGAYNNYCETRKVQFSSIDRTVKGNPQGGQILTSLSIGSSFSHHNLNISPFLSGKFMYLGMGSFKESGGQSLDLEVRSSGYSLFRGELGFNFNHCYNFPNFIMAADLDLAYIREQRFIGTNFDSKFVDYPYFTVKGMNPSRSAFSPDFNLSILSCERRKSLMVGYHAEIGGRYFEQNLYLEGSFQF
ncbi:MAG: autotransporter domain-containing protein [Chlamydiales bacterium]|nr:autotransporter domain-containing protein [Chlamydiales bacterium]